MSQLPIPRFVVREIAADEMMFDRADDALAFAAQLAAASDRPVGYAVIAVVDYVPGRALPADAMPAVEEIRVMVDRVAVASGKAFELPVRQAAVPDGVTEILP